MLPGFVNLSGVDSCGCVGRRPLPWGEIKLAAGFCWGGEKNDK